MAHDHDCDLLVSAADVPRLVLEMGEALEQGGEFMLVVCTDLLNHEDGNDCEQTLEHFLGGGGGGGGAPPDFNQVNQLKVYELAAWESGRQGWCFCDLFVYDLVGQHVRIREDHCYLIPFPAKMMLPPRCAHHAHRIASHRIASQPLLWGPTADQ